jgi:hypothetical protein
MTLKCVGQMPALVALMPLQILLDVTAGGAKNGLILIKSRLVASGGVGAATGTTWVASVQVGCASSITFGSAKTLCY